MQSRRVRRRTKGKAARHERAAAGADSKADNGMRAAPPPKRPRRTGRRRWLYRLLSATVVPLLFFLLLEGGLRVCGFGDPTRFFVKIEGRDAYTTNPRFGWRFFPPAMARQPVVCELPAEKPENTYRIFVVGGSAAQGIPNPAFSFGRMLAVMLEERCPGVRFEVINTAMTAINSHVVLPIARDCTDHQPDLFVVYMGNNEVVGPYGSGTIFGGFSPRLSVIRTSIFVKSTRIGQLLAKALGGRDAHREWQGMRMFLEHRVAAHDSRMDKVHSHFRANLTDICQVARASGAKVLVCTVPTNVRDSPPFASLHREDLTESDRKQWEKIYDAAVASASAGRHDEAVERFLEAAEIDGGHAELHFRLGRCLLVRERFEEAREHFTLARDLDALRFRADTRVNRIIREVAACAENGVSLVDTERAFEESEWTPAQIPGRELFYEHVHMTPEGNYLLAKAVFEQVVAILPQSVCSNAPALAAVPPDLCFERIALTDSNRCQMQEEISATLRQAPFSHQLDAAQRDLDLSKQLAELREVANSPAALQKARRWYAAAIERKRDDPELRREFARLLERHGDYEGARGQWHALVERFPYVAAWHLELGTFLLNHGKLAEAIGEFREAMRIDRSLAGSAYAGIGSALERGGKRAEAEQVYRETLALDPNLPVVHNALGALLFQQGAVEEASLHFRRALEIDPEIPAPHANLALILTQQGNLPEAVEHCRQLLRIEPDGAEAVWIMEQVCRQTGYRNLEFLDTLAKAYAGAGQSDKAVATAGRALQLAEGEGDRAFAERIRRSLSAYKQIQAASEERDP